MAVAALGRRWNPTILGGEVSRQHGHGNSDQLRTRQLRRWRWWVGVLDSMRASEQRKGEYVRLRSRRECRRGPGSRIRWFLRSPQPSWESSFCIDRARLRRPQREPITFDGGCEPGAGHSSKHTPYLPHILHACLLRDGSSYMTLSIQQCPDTQGRPRLRGSIRNVATCRSGKRFVEVLWQRVTVAFWHYYYGSGLPEIFCISIWFSEVTWKFLICIFKNSFWSFKHFWKTQFVFQIPKHFFIVEQNLIMRTFSEIVNNKSTKIIWNSQLFSELIRKNCKGK